MSSRIRIGQDERELPQADEHWIVSRIKQEEANQGSVCIRVFIKVGDVDITLNSGGCPAGGGGERQATPKELELFDLWNKLGLKTSEINGGKVIAFLKQIRRIV
ncbi:MAG: hypothetical protein ACYDAI_08035 [Trichloromonadaceae bacterium]